MECGIEGNSLRKIWKHIANRLNSKKMRRIVKRREVAADGNLPDYFVIDENTLVKVLGALHDTVAYRIYVRE